jgi:hypothetical protein
MHAKSNIIILTIASLICSQFFFLSCGNNKNTPEYVTKQYLIALKNKDYDKAKKYTDHTMGIAFDLVIQKGFDFGVDDVKDIKCSVNGNEAICLFCCSKDSNFNCVDLFKKDGEPWKIVIPKENSCRDSN